MWFNKTKKSVMQNFNIIIFKKGDIFVDKLFQKYIFYAPANNFCIFYPYFTNAEKSAKFYIFWLIENHLKKERGSKPPELYWRRTHWCGYRYSSCLLFYPASHLDLNIRKHIVSPHPHNSTCLKGSVALILRHSICKVTCRIHNCTL